ncbi:MAG: glycosyltransferase family 4 protein [Saprospiraceae bacterium]|nr:glycosyltransferase family 4 protein [Saprospiraceae bacterium]
MRILVNARFLIKGQLEGIGLYSYEILRRMVCNQPEDHFIFCFDRPYDRSFVFADNVTPIIVHPPARHPLLFIWWFEIGIRTAYRQHHADVFFSPDGFLSLSERVQKQVLVIHDLAYIHYPQQVGFVERWYYRYFMPKFIHIADKIITVSQASANDIATHFPHVAGKTNVIYNGGRSLFTNQENPLQVHAEIGFGTDKDYFLVIGAIHPRKNLARTLIAYRHFRDQSKRKTKLLIVGRKAWKTKSLESTYAGHPYKADISFLGFVSNDKLGQLLSGAKGLIFVSLFEGFGLPIIEAMQAGVPVITSNRSAMKEIAGQAAILVDPERTDEIAQAMVTLLESEQIVKSLITKGLARARRFSWDSAALQVSDIIRELVTSGKA